MTNRFWGLVRGVAAVTAACVGLCLFGCEKSQEGGLGGKDDVDLAVSLVGAAGDKASAVGENTVTLKYDGELTPGDAVRISVSQQTLIKMQIDSAPEAFVYPENGEIIFTVPLQQNREIYDDAWFAGTAHTVRASVASKKEREAERNLAFNPYATIGNIPFCYPFPSATGVLENAPAFLPRNATDGQLTQGWTPDEGNTAAFTVSFGREVTLRRIGIRLGAASGGWTGGRLVFSDGTSIDVAFTGATDEQVFEIDGAVHTDSVTLQNLTGAPAGEAPPSVVEFAAYGID